MPQNNSILEYFDFIFGQKHQVILYNILSGLQFMNCLKTTSYSIYPAVRNSFCFPTKFPFEPAKNAWPSCRTTKWFLNLSVSTLNCSLSLSMELAHNMTKIPNRLHNIVNTETTEWQWMLQFLELFAKQLNQYLWLLI